MCDSLWSKQLFKTTADLELINPAALSSLFNQMLLPWERTLQFSPERFALSLVLVFELVFFSFLFSKTATELFLFHQGTDNSVFSFYDSHLCLLLRMEKTSQ